MSAKWRALQHRHRYTYSSVSFPQHYIEQLEKFPDTKFYSGLKELARLNSTYAQVEHAKRVAAAFTGFLSSADISVLPDAARLYLEIMFFENSLPLHRTLVSALAKARDHQSLIGASFKALCEEYGGGPNKKGKRFLVSRAALSIMGMPKLGYLIDVVEECAVLVAWDVVNGLNGVFSESDSSSRPSPIVMEQYQEALSCLYYLLQKFPSKFKDLSEVSIMGPILEVVLRILRTMYFSRDCFVAAGVSVCAGLQVCLSPEELGLFIIKGMFSESNYICSGSSEGEYMGAIAKIQYGGDLLCDILNLSVLSRLCLIRGILTSVSRNVLNMPFTVATDELDNSDGSVVSKKSIKTVLYDGILPELCNYCENPTDSHFNFHSLTVMQICLQQIKTSMLSDRTVASDEYCPIGEEMGTRILRIIWNNLEDPLSQTVKQVHLIFDLFLDIQSTLNWGEGGGKIKPFLEKIASDLLHLGSQCKGRYVPLAILTKRLGAKALFSMSPGLLFETMHAYIDDDVCCALTSFLKCFLESLRDEFWNSDGVENGYLLYRECCLPPLLNGLASGVSKLRSNLNTYALSVVLEIDVNSIFPLLGFVLEQSGLENVVLKKEVSSTTVVALQTEQKVAVLVSLLKVSRMLALIEGDIDWCNDPNGGLHSECNKSKYAALLIKGMHIKIPIEWLEVALAHVDESLRVDAAEFLFLNPKTSSLPSHLELTLMKEAVPLNMRSPSTAFQMKWGSLFRKFFSRVRTSLERQFKQHSWTPLLSMNRTEDVDGAACRADNLFRFVRWLGCFLFFSCYPSAPYRRKIMATELIQIMIDAWPISPSDTVLCPYSEGITSPDSTFVLVGSIVDSWDKLRDSSFSILLHFPTPLPGFSSEETVVDVIKWAKVLVCSPRVRESDAGALTLRLIFRKYVLDLGWIVGASVEVICQSHSDPRNGISQNGQQKYPVISYLRSLIDWLEVSVIEGERDLAGACRNSFVHGVLLALRYTFEELDWNSDVPASCILEMRSALEKLLNLVLRVTSLALWVVSADAWFLPEDMDEMIDDDSFVLEDVQEATNNVFEHDHNSKGGGRDSKSSDQIVMVGCWLAMKEVSLLLGTIVRKIPLPSSTPADSAIPDSPTSGDAVLDLQQLKTMGDNFLEVLLKMKHNGAIDKTRAGFSALCNRLLCSDDPRLCKLPESWMEQLMQRTSAKGQLVDNLLRRSAGIPAAFIALFLSEPVGAPKKLLPQALRWLIDLANTTLQDPNTTTIPNGDLSSTKPKQEEESSKISKVRDEGVVPTVHAFNVLRTAFNDANLSADTSGFSAEALIASVRAFSSPYWEVRNSACLAYTALVRRMVGFLNVQKRDSARRALTGLEFFHRYPLLHSFLFNELKVATELLVDGRSVESNYREKAVHPSLCPVLIFLSRLKPSSLASEIGDDLDPFLFMPFIRKCSTQCNMRVRILASRALTGLVSNEKLPSVLVNIATELSYSNGTEHPSLNLMHGILLQLGNLLDINCRNLSDSAKKDQILSDLIKVLAKSPWIGNPRLCPCPVLNTSFLKVLHHMLSIAQTCPAAESFIAIQNLLLELTTQCLELDASCGLPFYDPTAPELREQASTSYLSSFVRVGDEGSSSSDLLETLIRVLSDSAYEARLAALKWLLKFLTTMEPDNGGLIAKWAKTNLHDKLMSLLASEEHHKCKYYILRIFFAWNSMQFKRAGRDGTAFVGSMDCGSLLQVWDKLVSVYNSSRHIKTRETIICCLGVSVKPFVETLTSFVLDDTKLRDTWGRLYSCVCFTCDLIKQHSSSSEPGNMRKAAAESMIASGLLEQAELIGPFVSGNNRTPSEGSSSSEPNDAVNLYAGRVLSMWFTCIRLLEDEDDEIRNKLALDLQKCFSSRKWNDGGVVSTQVDKVIEMSFDHLSSVFGQWVDYFDRLARWVSDMSNCDVFEEEDLVKRVFDKEIDNHHEEKLLICQICCFHIEKLSKSSDRIPDRRDYLYDWRLRFRNQLVSFSKKHIGKERNSDWIGGVGNHKDVFLPLYANMLGFYVFSCCLSREDDDEEEQLLLDAVELGKSLSPLLKNPLVQNLYYLVVKIHEEKVRAEADLPVSRFRAEGLPWDGFDPYFLIR